jgi:hypothetical protein
VLWDTARDASLRLKTRSAQHDAYRQRDMTDFLLTVGWLDDLMKFRREKSA